MSLLPSAATAASPQSRISKLCDGDGAEHART